MMRMNGMWIVDVDIDVDVDCYGYDGLIIVSQL